MTFLTTDDFPSPTRDALASTGALRADELHPSTKVFVRRMSRYGGLSDRVSVANARRTMQRMMPMIATRPAVDSVIDRTISGPAGPIAIRIVTPHAGSQPRSALLWFPGGGFVIGDLVTAEPTARSLAVRTGAVVVCVDYRKAPEHGLDDGYDDALAAVRWVIANAASLGVDPARVGVGGDSAGGNVAAVVAQEYSAGNGQPLATQLLVYPSVSVENEPARARNADGGTLDLEAMRWFETHVAGGIDPGSERYSPMVTRDLSHLPPTIIVTAGYDPLRDEGLVYLDRLRAAGVRAEHLHYADDVHGFFLMDRILANAVHALDATSTLMADILGADSPPAALDRAGADAIRVEVTARLRARQAQITYVAERVMHLHVRVQRRIIQFLGLPSGREVEMLNTRIKRLDYQVRSLRRQLERPESTGNSAS